MSQNSGPGNGGDNMEIFGFRTITSKEYHALKARTMELESEVSRLTDVAGKLEIGRSRLTETIAELERTNTGLRERNQELESENGPMKKQVKVLETRVERLQDDISAENETVKSLREEIGTKSDKVRELLTQIETLDDDIATLRYLLLEKAGTAVREELAYLNENQPEITSGYDQMEESALELAKDINKAEAYKDKSAARARLYVNLIGILTESAEDAERQIQNALSEKSKLEQRKQHLEEMLVEAAGDHSAEETLAKEIIDVENAIAEKDRHINTATAAAKGDRAKAAMYSKKIDAINADTQGWNEIIAALRKRYSSFGTSIGILKARHEKMTPRIEALQNTQEKLDRYWKKQSGEDAPHLRICKG